MALRAVFRKEVTSVCSSTKWAHALALPAPSDQAIESPTTPLLSLSEHDFSFESSFGDGSMELMAVPKRKNVTELKAKMVGPMNNLRDISASVNTLLTEAEAAQTMVNDRMTEIQRRVNEVSINVVAVNRVIRNLEDPSSSEIQADV